MPIVTEGTDLKGLTKVNENARTWPSTPLGSMGFWPQQIWASPSSANPDACVLWDAETAGRVFDSFGENIRWPIGIKKALRRPPSRPIMAAITVAPCAVMPAI